MRPLLAVLTVLLLALVAAPADAARTWGAYGPVNAAVDAAGTSAALTPGGVALTWTADGGAWGAIVPGMAPTRLGDGRNVDVHTGTAGGTLFTWTDGSGDVGNDQGYARFVSSGYGSETVALGRQATWLPIADVSSWGNMTVATGTDGRVLVRQRQSSQSGWTGPVDVAAGTPHAVGGTGREAFVAYEQGSQLRVARIQDDRVVDDVAVPDAEPGAIVASPKITVDDTGSALLVALQPRPGGAATPNDQGRPLHAVRWTRSGSWTRVPEISGWALEAAVDNGAGDATVAWAEQPTLDPGPLRMVTGSPSTGVFSAPVTLDAGRTAGVLIDIALSAGTLITYGTDTGVRTIRRDYDGPFQPSRSVSCPGDTSAVLAAGMMGPLTGAVVRGSTSQGGPLRIVTDEEAATAGDVRCGGAVPTGLGPGIATGPSVVGPSVTGAKPSMTAPKGQKLKTVLRKGLKLSLVVPQAGKPSVTLGLSRKQARKLRLGRKAMTIGKRALDLEAGKNAVTVPIAKRVRRKLGKAKTVTVRVRVFTAYGTIFDAPVTLKR